MKKLSVCLGSEVGEKNREKHTCLICPLTFSVEERCVILHFNEISPCLARTISEQDQNITTRPPKQTHDLSIGDNIE